MTTARNQKGSSISSTRSSPGSSEAHRPASACTNTGSCPTWCGDRWYKWRGAGELRSRGVHRDSKELLSSPAFTDFTERATAGRMDVFGDVAHWFGSYTKSWTERGTSRHGRGAKSIQLVRVANAWRISALAWDDARPS